MKDNLSMGLVALSVLLTGWVALMPTTLPLWLALIPGAIGFVTALRVASVQLASLALLVCVGIVVVDTPLIEPGQSLNQSSLARDHHTPGPGEEVRDNELGFTVLGVKRPNRLQRWKRWTVVTVRVRNHAPRRHRFALDEHDGYFEGDWGPDARRGDASVLASTIASGRDTVEIAPGGTATMRIAFPTLKGRWLTYVVLYDHRNDGGAAISVRDAVHTPPPIHHRPAEEPQASAPGTRPADNNAR